MEKNQVLAIVGEKQITQGDIEKVITSLDPQRAMQFQSEDGMKKLVEELVNQELFYVDAIARELDKDPVYINEIEKMKENLLKQYAINLLLKDANLSDEELLAYYNAHPEQFINPESVKASHILVEDEAAALSILAEINEGLSFEEAAQKASKCPSNAQGGDLGFFTKGRMVPEFEAAAFELAVSEISQPVETQFGYHIIKVVERKAQEVSPFEEIKGHLAQGLVTQRQQELYYNRVEELKTQYPVKINL